jgi:protein-S-isoprenylcysteine O-methyltransferase Ste14
VSTLSYQVVQINAVLTCNYVQILVFAVKLTGRGVEYMQGYFAIATVILLVILVLSRVYLMSGLGIKAMKFGGKDKKDFLIPPLILLLIFYLIFAKTLNLPDLDIDFLKNDILSWTGVAFCMLGLVFFLLSLISFGKSFRVGIDDEHPGKLVTTGIFAFSRNPIYTSFGLILLGMFLIFPNWILLLYVVAGFWLFNRQVLREEESLKKIYGEEYAEYCKKVRRYL